MPGPTMKPTLLEKTDSTFCQFPATRWATVSEAQGHDGAACRALNELCAQYWLPIYSFIRRKGYSPADAEDLTQGFFAEFLSRHSLDTVGEEKGRLRTFLLKAVTRHISHVREKGTAVKRGGGVPILSLDVEKAEGVYVAEPSHDLTPDRVFERQWALTLLERALDVVRSFSVNDQRSGLFEDLKGLISLDAPVASYELIAARNGLSVPAVKSAAHRLRQSFRVALRALVAETVASGDEIDDEIQHMCSLFATSGPYSG
jgi:RNA polymerase sigma-70 factor (ECF subfamily)